MQTTISHLRQLAKVLSTQAYGVEGAGGRGLKMARNVREVGRAGWLACGLCGMDTLHQGNLR